MLVFKTFKFILKLPYLLIAYKSTQTTKGTAIQKTMIYQQLSSPGIYEPYLLIMGKSAPSSTITFTSLERMTNPPGLPLLLRCLFIFFFFLLVLGNVVNPYNSAKNLSSIQII